MCSWRIKWLNDLPLFYLFYYVFFYLFYCLLPQDVFTVSVGNLPPHATVIIEVTYVAELQVEGENIVFSIPGSVAPWKETGALDDVTQVSQLLYYFSSFFYVSSHTVCCVYIHPLSTHALISV